MSGFKIELKGFDEVIGQLDGKKLESDISLVMGAFGQDVAREAKQLAPVDEGFLKNQIGSVTEGLTTNIFCNADYAAYLEFGTRKFAAAYVSTLPPTWQAFAAQFKGAGSGSFQEMVARITAWVKRKGIAAQITKSGKASKSKASISGQDEAAYRIALFILRNGIRPHPFLFPAFEKQYPILIQDLKDLLQ